MTGGQRYDQGQATSETSHALYHLAVNLKEHGIFRDYGVRRAPCGVFRIPYRMEQRKFVLKNKNKNV